MGARSPILLGGLVSVLTVTGSVPARASPGMPSDCGLVNWHDGKPARQAELETICAYFRYVHREDFPKAYGLFSKSLQKKVSYAGFLAAINVAPVNSTSGVSTVNGDPRPQASSREFLGAGNRADLGHAYTFGEDFPNFTDSTTLAFEKGADGTAITGFDTTRNW